MPKHENSCTTTIEPKRLEQMLQRLEQDFYDEVPASTQIAAAVLPDLMNLDESSPALPH